MTVPHGTSLRGFACPTLRRHYLIGSKMYLKTMSAADSSSINFPETGPDLRLITVSVEPPRVLDEIAEWMHFQNM